eukprot:CAMPEP_0196653988 /NCGR_PEP_ID=MMETSP1086-20130531/3656_1 /TAXON_ID=77921 /ORGANISM="Cyanoptyche  gloeocystis , Strain SAG4.97" /LENGTH=77 /DNA_ID=CAMNT_0041985475 /DNA_START=785 /DNA_END=1016 /DNA_ORIENTATION=+
MTVPLSACPGVQNGGEVHRENGDSLDAEEKFISHAAFHEEEVEDKLVCAMPDISGSPVFVSMPSKSYVAIDKKEMQS